MWKRLRRTEKLQLLGIFLAGILVWSLSRCPSPGIQHLRKQKQNLYVDIQGAVRRRLLREWVVDLGTPFCTPLRKGEDMVVEFVSAYAGFFQDPVVFDIGAHNGETALLLQKSMPDNVRIHSFEPVLANAERVEKIADERTTVHRTAVVDSAASKHMRIHCRTPTCEDEQSTFETTLDYSMLVNVTQVSEVLRDFGKNLYFLKIDAQGHDSKLIFSAQAALDSKVLNFVMWEFEGGEENSPKKLEAVCSLLERHGFLIYRITPAGLVDMGSPERRSQVMQFYGKQGLCMTLFAHAPKLHL